MARAKQTDRAEARRRYRQATAQTTGDDGAEDAGELDYGERKPSGGGKAAAQPARRETPAPTGRVGFTDAFRLAYKAPHVREDLVALPKLLVTRGFLAAVGLVLAGFVVVLLLPNYTGSRFAWELLVFPGSALAPQLVAGFFAPRASYLLGLLIGILQGVIFTVAVTVFGDRLGTELPSDQIGSLLSVSFVSGPISGALFAAAAAWYRRFLSFSSPRRGPAGRSNSAKKSGR